MPPAASELDPLTSYLSLSTAPKPITSADALSLSISNSTYASHYTISKALLVRNPVCSSLDLNKVRVKKEEKEKSRRSNRDTHSAPSSIQHRQAFQYRSRNHSKTEGSASYQLDHAMRYRDDYRVPTSCTEKGNRGNSNYNKAKSSEIPLHLPSHGGKTFVPGPRAKRFPLCLTKTTLESGNTLVPSPRTKRVPTCLA